MIAFEIALLMFLGVVAVMGIRHIAKPITEAYAEKVKFGYRELGSQSEKELKEKVSALEDEIMNLKQQVKSLQESVDFAIEQKQSVGDSTKIKIPKEKKHS
jgi:hypothetical protein